MIEAQRSRVFVQTADHRAEKGDVAEVSQMRSDTAEPVCRIRSCQTVISSKWSAVVDLYRMYAYGAMASPWLHFLPKRKEKI